MAYFLTNYGLFFSDRNYEIQEFNSEDDASNYAEQQAMDWYESFAGSHGILSQEEVCEDEGIDIEDDESWFCYMQHVQNNIDYSAEEVYMDSSKIWRYSNNNAEVDMDDVDISRL